jgi:hypothetical protein
VQRSSVGCSLTQWKNTRTWRPEFGPEGILFVSGNTVVYSFILGGAAKLRWAGGGAKRPDGHGNELKKTGARSARARTRGQNPLVSYSFLGKHKMKLQLQNGRFCNACITKQRVKI